MSKHDEDAKTPRYEDGDRWYRKYVAPSGAFTEAWYNALRPRLYVRTGTVDRDGRPAGRPRLQEKAAAGAVDAIYKLRKIAAVAEKAKQVKVAEWTGSREATLALQQAAARVGDDGLQLAAVQELLAKGADPATRDFSPGYALFVCARYGNVDTARALIRAGAQPDPINPSLVSGDRPGSTPLVLAGTWEQPEFMEAMLDCGASVPFNYSIGLNIALEYIAEIAGPKQKDLKYARVGAEKLFGPMIRLLIEHGADARDPLHLKFQSAMTGKPQTPPDLGAPEALRDRDWLGKVTKALEGDDATEIILGVLSRPAVIKNPRWTKAVLAALESQQTYRAVSKVVYERPVSYADDSEGPLGDSWRAGDYSDLPAILQVFRAPAARKHPGLEDLVKAFVEACVRTDFFPAGEFKRFTKTVGGRTGREFQARFDAAHLAWKRRVHAV